MGSWCSLRLEGEFVIRKQFYLHPVQNVALKRKAHSLEISQSELLRRALDTALSKKSQLLASEDLVLERVLENSLQLSEVHRLSDGDQLKRDDAYSSEPRFMRWEQA